MSPEVQASTQRDRRAWARRHNHALVSLARRVWQDDCGLEDAFALICETAAETLEVERVNIWRHDPDARLLHCLHHYERKGARHRRPCDLQLRVDGGYSQALAEVRVINLSMVERDGNDDALAQYLREHRIGSLLDAPVRSAGELLGVARVPLAERYTYVQNGLAVGPDGCVYALLTHPERVEVVRLGFSTQLEPILPTPAR